MAVEWSSSANTFIFRFRPNTTVHFPFGFGWKLSFCFRQTFIFGRWWKMHFRSFSKLNLLGGSLNIAANMNIELAVTIKCSAGNELFITYSKTRLLFIDSTLTFYSHFMNSSNHETILSSKFTWGDTETKLGRKKNHYAQGDHTMGKNYKCITKLGFEQFTIV
jgi:hypothetical protein